MSIFVRQWTGIMEMAGTKAPWWMGKAYCRFDQDCIIMAIIPLNWIMRWGLALYIKLKWPGKEARWEEALRQAFYRGKEAGYQKGLRQAAEFELKRRQEKLQKD